MLFRLFLLFTLVPLVELVLLLEIGQRLGAWPTLGLVVLTGALGACLARLTGLHTLQKLRDDLVRGVPPVARLFDAALIFAAGLLLITPGILTDGAGLALLLPPVRDAIRKYLKHRFLSRMTVHPAAWTPGSSGASATAEGGPVLCSTAEGGWEMDDEG
jgi:UPF0716 protein FxsA